MAEIKEAEIISEKENISLEIIDPEAEITSVGKVTSNITEVKNQALEMKEHYSKIIVTNDNLNIAKDDKANINKIVDKVANYRKNIVSEFKKPIETFETLAKETEKILKETYDIINSQCNAFDEKRKEESKEELKRYFDEYKQSKNIAFVQYTDMNQPVGLSDISDLGVIKKKKYTEINEFIDSIENDINTIESMQDSNEILAEYMKDRNLARSIKDIQDRHAAITKIKEMEEQRKNIEVVEEKQEVEVLQAPVVQNTTTQEELIELDFKVICSYSKGIKLIQFMESEGIEYEQLEQQASTN